MPINEDATVKVSGLEFQFCPETLSEARQLLEFSRCLGVFVERNKKYRDLWKSDGLDGTLEHIKHKAKRIERMTDGTVDGWQEMAIDDLTDLINYSVFALRHLTGDEGIVKGIDVSEG